MPIIYLSPSTQEYNPYVTTGNEEFWMNLLADEMEPLLEASGIEFIRNNPNMTAGSSILASNSGNYDLHLALHSNASGEEPGAARGILAFYWPGSSRGKRAAQALADALRAIYPLPELVRAEPTTTLGEVRRVRAPAVLLELGFHDNREDADWITSHIYPMAEAIVRGLTDYFEIPFFPSTTPLPAVVRQESGPVNVYARPDTASPVQIVLYPGAQVLFLNEAQGWYLIRFGGETGYVPGDHLQIQ